MRTRRGWSGWLALGLAAGLAACGGGAGPGHPGGTAASSPPARRAPTVTRLVASVAPWSLPAPVSRPATVVQGDHIVILGGLTSGDVSTDAVVVLDPASGNTQRPGRLEEAVHDAAAAVVGSDTYVFGGGSYATVAAVQDWTGGRSSTVAGSLPAARSDLSAVTVGDSAFVLGGFDGTQMQTAILATTDGAHFRVAGELPVGVRYAAAAVDGRGRIWLVGGNVGTTEGSGAPTDVIQRFDPASGTATVVGHLPVATGHAAALALGGAIFVAGGRTSAGATDAIWRIDTDTGRAYPAGHLPGPRSDAGAAVVGGLGYLIGGELVGPQQPLASAVELTPAP